MSTVSITTTQNVTIDHNLAGFRDRLLAFLIDLLIISAWIVLHRVIATLAFKNEYYALVYSYAVVIPFFSFYTLAFEFFLNGQTPGKQSMNICVVMLNGKEPGFIDFFTRWSLRFLEIYLSSGVIAAIMVNTTTLHQRLADIVAGTVVVKVHGKNMVNSDDLLKINSQNNYKAQYPQVIQFTEDEMLTVKKLLDRLLKFHNKAHRDLAEETAMKLASKMGVQIKESKPELFLKTLIRDYVVLTR